jgi:hypothetical protein
VPRQKLVTADVISQLESWVNSGLSAAAIAERIGCTLGTLRVRCSQFGISLRRKRSPIPAATEFVGLHLVPAESPRLTPSAEKKPSTPSKELDAGDGKEHIVVAMALPTVHQLRSRAARKGISESTLAMILLETVVRDDLYDAVLDEGSDETGRPMSAVVRR